MILEGKADQLLVQLKRMFPDAPATNGLRVELLGYQTIALFGLAQHYSQPSARILDIGTGRGASAFIMARAAPLSHVVSLTINPTEARTARASWIAMGCINIEGSTQASWDYLNTQRKRWDLVFVDGDHNQIGRDMPWWNRLKVGGLFLCHDYSPPDCPHASPIVFDTLNAFAAQLGRTLDVRIVDDSLTGMAGLYRREGETWTI